MILTKTLAKLANRVITAPAIGIDISDRTVKFIQFAEKDSRLEVSDYGGALMERNIVADGEIKKPRALIDALCGLRIAGSGLWRDRFVVASLPEEKSFLRIIKVPRVKLDEVENKIRWELEGNIPLPPEDVYFDYEIMPGGEALADHFDVLTAACPKTIVESYVEVLRGAGMIPLALEVEAQSLARALIDRANPKDSRIIVDIGASRTSFVLISKGNIALTSTIALSGAGFHKLIGATLGVSLEEAEKIKQRVGLRRDLYEGKVGDALKPVLTELIREIEKHIEYYSSRISGLHENPKDISAIVLTGGEATLIGLDAFLAKALRKPVLIGDAFQAIRARRPGYIPPLSRRESLQFTTAAGLAMRSIEI